MNKIITLTALILLVFSSNAQETLIVRGYLERPNTHASINLQKNMFCYLKGDYIMPEYNSFCTFSVDSVINGSFLNFKDEINQPPFNIMVALINECTILDSRQNYTLRIKRFPHSNYYYIDSLNQVSPNEKYSDKLLEYYKNYQQNINILTEGNLQEKRDFLDKIQQYNYTSQNSDYRYISYILPFMTSKDTIINYGVLYWDGYDKKGRMIGGSEIYEEKGLLSDFLYDYLDKTLPFVLSDRTTDSISWHNWFDSICRSQDFLPIKYIKSEHKTIKTTAGAFGYFVPDISNRKIYFDFRNKAYVLNMDTDEIEEKQKSGNCNSPYLYGDYSIQNNEIPKYNSFNRGFYLSKLDNGVFCRQDDKIIPLNLQYNETPNSSFTYPNLIIHSDSDFLIFTSQNSDGYNCLKAGKINRKGEWIIKPKNLYKKLRESYVGNVSDIGTFSFFQSDENETTFAFSDRTYGRKSYSANEKDTDAIIIYKLNANLEVQDSVILTIDFPRFDYSFSETHLLKKDSTYLLLAQTGSNNNNQLYYRLLDSDLTPKTDFLKLADCLNSYNSVSNPILTTEGFMISWIDNDLSEGILRSVLIDKSGKQSDIINITNQKTDNIYNVEFDINNVDIYLFNNDEKTLVRKRIDKKEYGL
ncbi:MAG: hypothetical protein FWF54_01790 [Candidatus Azobacteroides sp.]|nr:hypothetical protein [Candidatus Azobacteroides sp.]